MHQLHLLSFARKHTLTCVCNKQIIGDTNLSIAKFICSMSCECVCMCESKNFSDLLILLHILLEEHFAWLNLLWRLGLLISVNDGKQSNRMVFISLLWLFVCSITKYTSTIRQFILSVSHNSQFLVVFSIFFLFIFFSCVGLIFAIPCKHTVGDF